MNGIVPSSLGLVPKYYAPSSWWEHVPVAHWIVEQLRPKRIVELGSHYGVSLFSFCEAAEAYSPETFVYGVDTWEGDEQAGYYKESVYEQVANNQELNHRKRCRLIRSTFDEASKYFEDKSIDLLHIDGLHTYEAVKHDYSVWVKKVKDGGTILFHDCNVRERSFGVWKLWNELKIDRSIWTLELQNGHGLGIATLSHEKPEWHGQISCLFDILKTKGHLLSQMDRINSRYLCMQDANRTKAEELKSLKIHIESLEEVISRQKQYIKTRFSYRVKKQFKKIIKALVFQRKG